jgi:hypothetical protein
MINDGEVSSWQPIPMFALAFVNTAQVKQHFEAASFGKSDDVPEA